MVSNYRKIKGINYDRILIDMTETSVSDKTNETLSLKNAKMIIKQVKNANTYTDIEIRTLKYIQDNYKFTDEAAKWFRTEINIMSETKKDISHTIPRTTSKPSREQKQIIKKDFPKQKYEVELPIKDELLDESSKVMRVNHEEMRSSIETKKTEPKDNIKKIVLSVFCILLFAVILILFFNYNYIKRYFTKKDITSVKTPLISDIDTGKPEVQREIPETKEILKVDDFEYYTIIKNDNLIEISYKFYGNHSYWRKIYEANLDIIKNPELIYTGDKIRIPKIKGH